MNLFNILLTYRKTWLGDIPRSLFSSIDSAVYQMISSVYGLIEDLAHVQIFKEGVIQNFYNKTYALLAIFMVFKLTFSIVSYVLDPAKVTDKSAGFGKIITNVMIMFVMILSAPVVFKNLYKLQEMILDEGVIYNFLFQQGDQEINADGEKKLIIGDPEACKNWRENPDYYGSRSELINSEVGSWYVANNGDYISLMLYRNFFNLGTLNDGQNLGYRTGDDADNSYQYLCNGKDITVHGYSDITDLIDMINDTVNRSGKNDYYVIDYKYVVGTAVGVFVLLELISIAFDVAVRAIKLGFLQLIAPIPIMSYIDPKSGKNGMFSNWIKEVGKTWISLFTRLFAVFFAVFIISSIDYAMVESINTDNYTMQSKSFFIIMFVIIGALMFAKQLPQLLEQLIPGMKMGKMQLNPFKKIADEALGGKLVTGAAVGAAAMGARGLSQAGSNLYAFGRNRHNLKKGIAEAEAKGDYDKAEKLKRQLNRNNFGRAVGTTFGGFAGGATRGLKSGYNTGKSGSGNIFKGTKQDLQSGNTKRNNRAAINDYNAELKSQLKDGKISNEDYKNGKYNFWDRNVVENLDKVSGVKNSYGGYGYYNDKISDLQRKIENNNETEHSMRDAIASYSSNHGISTLDLYDFHKNNSNKSNIELEQSLLDKYTKDSSGNVIRGTTSDGKIAFKDTDEDRKLQAKYEKERKLLDGYKEQRSQLEAINKVDEETKELKKEQKQYKEMLNSRPNEGGKK